METEGRCSLAWGAAYGKGIRNISVLLYFSWEVECFFTFLWQGNERGGRDQKGPLYWPFHSHRFQSRAMNALLQSSIKKDSGI